ncbi:uncharacterized protein LOC142519251 isoform X3 [Primulina tabacum]|uniref:uncharacterized protein LOC142519251 isoform X3 n=1 Tax=Primulina tabacum TaxID=48773 RepID=UPI003F5A346B
MDQPPKPSPGQQSQPPAGRPQSPSILHQNDADEDDDNVKQLRECSSHYLALQELEVLPKGSSSFEGMQREKKKWLMIRGS